MVIDPMTDGDGDEPSMASDVDPKYDGQARGEYEVSCMRR